MKMTNNVTAVAENVFVDPNTGAASDTNNTPAFNNFVTSAPKELQELFSKNGVKDFETLNKSYSGLNSMLGKKGLVKPAEGASEEEIKTYNEKLYNEYLGVPTDGKYEFKIPDNIPQEVVSEEFLNDLQVKAKEVGVSKDKFQDLVDVIYAHYGKSLENAVGPTLSDLQKEWGRDAEKNIQAAHAFYKNYMASDADADALAKKYGNDPIFLKGMHKLASLMKEDRLEAPQENKFSIEETKKSAMNKMREAMEARNKGNYILAESLQKEYQELLAKTI